MAQQRVLGGPCCDQACGSSRVVRGAQGRRGQSQAPQPLCGSIFQETQESYHQSVLLHHYKVRTDKEDRGLKMF